MPDDLDARFDAFTRARDLLFGVDASVEEMLIVADWALTGTADLALKISEQSARNYRDFRQGDIDEKNETEGE